MILKLNPNLGIGDLLICLSYIKLHYNEYEKFHIVLNYDIIKIWRNDSQSIKKFTKDISEIIFNDPKIILYEFNVNNDYSEYIGTGILQVNLWHEYNFRPCNLEHIIKDFKCEKIFIKDKELNFPFFVLNTKVRLEKYDYYLSYKDKFYNLLNKLSYKYKLLLMGERKIPMNKEYLEEPSDIKTFLLYEDIINNINKENIIDNTKEDLLHENNINDFLRDCYLINKSNFSIFLGMGGAPLITMSFSKKTYGFRTLWDLNDNNNYISSKNIDDEKLFLTNDINKYLNKINELI